MTLNYKAISKIFGTILLLLGISMIPSLLVSVTFREKDTASAFLITMIPLIIIGFVMMHFIRPESPTLKMRDGIFTVTIAWILASVAGAVPLVISGEIPNFCDALFETVSGFTTTGSTILTNIEALTKGALFWRSSTQWLGGMGILVFTIALLPALGISGHNISAETTDPAKGKLSAKMSDSAKILYRIYIGITLIMVLLLKIGGMSFYDSFIHTFGAVSTSGFSNYNDSIGHFNSIYIEIIIALGVIICGINFNLLYQIIHKKFREVFRDSEFRFYLVIMGFVVLIVTLFLRVNNVYGSIGESLRYSFFQIASVMTTTGYNSTDFSVWPAFCSFIFITLMFVGGSSYSTAGSVKCIRILVMCKLIKQNIYARLHPRAVTHISLNGKVMSREIVAGISGFVFLYFSLVVIGIAVLTMQGTDFLTALSVTAAALGNTGSGLGMAGPDSSFSFFNSGTKLFLAFYMILGRLELYTVLLLFTPAFWNPDR